MSSSYKTADFTYAKYHYLTTENVENTDYGLDGGRYGRYFPCFYFWSVFDVCGSAPKAQDNIYNGGNPMTWCIATISPLETCPCAYRIPILRWLSPPYKTPYKHAQPRIWLRPGAAKWKFTFTMGTNILTWPHTSNLLLGARATKCRGRTLKED